MITKPLNKTYSLYGDTVKLVYNDVGHRYQVNGVEVMGVTTALSVISKPALIQWGINEALKFIKEEIKAGVSYDEIKLNDILTKAKVAHRRKKEEAADFGTMVHNWIEEYIKGKNPKPLVNELLKSACDTFVKWAIDNKVVFTASEKVIYSKKHNYAGTCDFTCEIEGKKYVGDLKTSKGIYDEYALQTSAYKLAIEEETKVMYDGMIIVRVPKIEDDVVEIVFINNYEKNARAFLSALYLKQHFNLLKAQSKGGDK